MLRRVAAAIHALTAPKKPAARLASGSYRAAWNPRSRVRAYDGSGDYHLDKNTLLRLRMLSRDLERNNDCYDGLLTNFCTFLVGSGPRPLWKSANLEWNAAASKYFSEAAKNKRLDGRLITAWAPWVAQLARAVARDGDAGVWHFSNGQAVVIESDRIEEVKLDDIGRITGYVVKKSDNSLVTLGYSSMSLIANRTRPSQTRGHPVLSASLDDWERLDSLNEAEIISAETASLPWLLLKHSGDQYNQILAGDGETGSQTPDNPYSNKPGWQRTDAGSIMGLPPGLDGTPWTPDRPNLNVPEFVRQQLRHMCLPLLPYEVAFLDIGNLNYAAIRGVGKLAERRLSDFRTCMLEPVLTRIASDFIRSAIVNGDMPPMSDQSIAEIEWQWDALEIRDREKDAVAVERELSNGTTTLLDEIGPEWRRTVQQRAEELAFIRSSALAAAPAIESDSGNLLNPSATPAQGTP